jgi:aspartyl aminopeptidase
MEPAKADWSFNQWLTKPKFSQAHPLKLKPRVGAGPVVAVEVVQAAATTVGVVMAAVVVVMTNAQVLKRVAKS